MRTTIRFSIDGERGYQLGTKLKNVLETYRIMKQPTRTATYKGSPVESTLRDATEAFWNTVRIHRRTHPNVRIDHFWMYVEASKPRRPRRRGHARI